MAPTLVLLLGKSHGQRNLAGDRPLGRKELDTTEHTCKRMSLGTSVRKGNNNNKINKQMKKAMAMRRKISFPSRP